MTTLTINLLGPFQVLSDGEAIDSFAYDKVRALLAYLALEADRPQRREALAALLWAEQGEKAARDSLRQALATLRNAIGDRKANVPFLFSNRETIQFNAASNFVLDAATFSELLAACDRHRHRRLQTCSACASRLMQAAELYRGELLTGFSSVDSAPFEQWLVDRREMLHRQALGALFTVAGYQERRGEFALAHQYARRQIALEPWREEAHCQVMRALALMGERSAALAQYERCRETLAEELGLSPSLETQRLAEQIREGVLAEARREPSVSGIPGPKGPIVGREAAVAHVCEQLADPDCRLFTIMGPGGIGKTRLVQDVATEMRTAFTGGVAYAALGPVRTGDELTRAIAEALDLRLTGHSTDTEQLLAYLDDKEVLLVLDNYEQLLPDVALLRRLAHRAPHVAALVTSRHRLGLSHEWTYDLEGLAYPRAFSERVEDFSAVQLFVLRARQADGRFVLTDADHQAVAHICRLVEGLPLAIELAAAATRYYSCAQIAGRIEDRRQVLVSGARDVEARQRSITATFAYSWALLAAEEQHIFAGLSVFRGGFDEAAAQAVTGATSQQLWSLADKSLLRLVGEGRYDMHELLRQFAAEKRQVLDGVHDGKRRHLTYYADLAEAGERGLRGAEQMQWLERLETERPNFNAALSWGLRNATEDAARLANANWLFWFMHTHLEEGQQWYERLLDAAGAALSPQLRARTLNGSASMALARSNYETLQRAATEGLALTEQLGDEEGISLALHHLSGAARLRGDHAASIKLHEEGLQVARAVNDVWLASVHLHGLAIAEYTMGRLNEAEELLQERNALLEKCGAQWNRLYGQYMLAEIKLSREQVAEARKLFLEGLPVVRTFRDRRLLSWAMHGLGKCAFEEGRLTQADGYLKETLHLEEQLGRKENLGEVLLLRGDIAVQQGDHERAAALYRQGRVHYQKLGHATGLATVSEKLRALPRLPGENV